MPRTRILIADENTPITQGLQQNLEFLGYQVVGITATGEETVQKTEELQPDLLMMDVRLKGVLDGIQAAQKIHQQFNIPIIYMTDNAGQTTVRRSRHAEPFGFMFKPIDEKNLYPAIEIALFRHQMEKRVKESEGWLNTILHNIGDAVMVINNQGLVQFMNPVAEVLTGCIQEQAKNRVLSDTISLLEEETCQPMDIINAWMHDKDGHLVKGYPALLRPKNGENIPIEINVSPIRDVQGTFNGLVLTFRDVSERRQAVQMIRRQANRAEALLNVASRLNTKLDLNNVLTSVCLETVQALGMLAAGVLLYDEEIDKFITVAEYSPDPRLQQFAQKRYEISRSLVDRIVSDLGPVAVIPDVQVLQDVPQRDLFVTLDVHTLAMVIIKQDQHYQGLLSVLSSGAIHEFTNDDLAFLKGLADQAATAITNARLFEQMRASRERLQVLSKQLVDVQEAEKQYLARELHDQIGQVLTGLQFSLESSKRLAEGTLKSNLEEAQALVGTLMRQVRELSLNLRPTVLDDMGLLSTLLWHLERYQRQTNIQVNFLHYGIDRRFPAETETAAYRIVQEALTNVARYAQVDKVDVKLHADEDILKVSIIDQGRGFDHEQVLAGKSAFGLTSMRERAYLLGGQLEIRSKPGEGTQILVDLPISQRLERRRSKRINTSV